MTENRWRTSRRNVAMGLALAATLMAGFQFSAMAAGRRRRPRRRPRPRPTSCFLTGTPILTPNGEVAVEALKAGDEVATVANGNKQIVRIERFSHVRAQGERWHDEVLPVRIKRSALGPEMPYCDIVLTRAHAIYVDGLLVPVGDLVNGRTIVIERAEDREVLDFYHIEVEGHDVVMAGGAPCETLLVDRSSACELNGVKGMSPIASLATYAGRRAMLVSRLRSAVVPVVDIRTPLDIIRDRLEARAEFFKAA